MSYIQEARILNPNPVPLHFMWPLSNVGGVQNDSKSIQQLHSLPPDKHTNQLNITELHHEEGRRQGLTVASPSTGGRGQKQCGLGCLNASVQGRKWLPAGEVAGSQGYLGL